jgi:hypothetical protein
MRGAFQLPSTMHREPRPHSPQLKTLLEERDHLRIKLSLLQDDAEMNVAEINRLELQLSSLERQIEGGGTRSTERKGDSEGPPFPFRQ